MPRVWIPVHCLLLPGHTELQRSTYCYFRYKFYHQDAFCSQMKHPSVEEGGEEDQATVTFQGSRTVELRSTQPLMWYLQEERLEVQVWVAFTKDKAQRPRDTDRLVGSAFVDLSSFAKTSKQKLTLSGKKLLLFFCHLTIISGCICESNHSFVVLQECIHCSDAQQQIYKGLLSECTSLFFPLWRTLLELPARWTLTTRESSYQKRWSSYQKRWKKKIKPPCPLHRKNHKADTTINPPEQLQTSHLCGTLKRAWMNLSL